MQLDIISMLTFALTYVATFLMRTEHGILYGTVVVNIYQSNNIEEKKKYSNTLVVKYTTEF